MALHRCGHILQFGTESDSELSSTLRHRQGLDCCGHILQFGTDSERELSSTLRHRQGLETTSSVSP